ncbi:hypothetical protein NQ317_012739 [Molorchus minor]|uniref:Gamma-tubulin complex component n=1 Tax=Molorchus minor TaxID=1323400 RepID=A0ABQ9K3B7_9CUCU|nr:hypothetical protein NQ317_012739 [Molorchus minor]
MSEFKLQHLVDELLNKLGGKSGAKGGNVLSLLHENVIGSIGDERAQQLCLKLMEAACEPYMKMLGMWIYRGIISDPIKEIMRWSKKKICQLIIQQITGTKNMQYAEKEFQSSLNPSQT